MDGPKYSPNEEAARWYARLNSPDCTAMERAEFAAWRECDPRNAAAYAAAERMSAALAALATSNPRLKAMVEQAASAGTTLPDETPEEEPGNNGQPLTITAGALRSGRRIARPFAWAAGLAVAVASALTLVAIGQRPAVVTEGSYVSGGGLPALRYRSGASRRAVVLEDGTRVSLDVASVIEVRIDDSQRAVTLVQGRALFDALHDASRPFVVSVGDEQVTALGTLFEVDRAPSEVVVTLAEGEVTVGRKSGGPTMQLLPGEQLRSSAGSTRWLKRQVNPRTVTSWSLSENRLYAQPLDALDNGNG